MCDTVPPHPSTDLQKIFATFVANNFLGSVALCMAAAIEGDCKLDSRVLELLCAANWESIGKELFAHVVWRCGKYRWRYGSTILPKGNEALDVVHETIERTLAGAQGIDNGRYRKWDPEKGPLVPWLKDQANSILDALVNSATHRREQLFSPEPDCDEERPTFPAKTESQIPDECQDALDDVIAKEERERAKVQVTKLLEAIDDDQELVDMAEAIMAGFGPEPRMLAEHLGVSTKDIYNRSKRLYRHAGKVVEP